MPQTQIILMLAVFGVFWFILIRPQVKRQKEHQAMLGALKKGDEVITRGGLIGRISTITDLSMTVELNDKSKVRVLKAYVDGLYKPTILEKSAGSAA